MVTMILGESVTVVAVAPLILVSMATVERIICRHEAGDHLSPTLIKNNAFSTFIDVP